MSPAEYIHKSIFDNTCPQGQMHRPYWGEAAPKTSFVFFIQIELFYF